MNMMKESFMDENKTKALQAALSQIEKQFGKGSIMKMGDGNVIPDIIPGVGYGDDWGALVAALGTVAAYIKDEHKFKATAQVERLFGSPKSPPPSEFIE